MRSKASIKGHPVHPTLVVLPIGLYVATFLADVAFFFTHHNPMWVVVSFGGGVAAVITALLAAFFGYVDYKSIVPDRAYKTARLHMYCNLATMFLFVIGTCLLRSRHGYTAHHMALVTLLELLGIVLTAFAGYLGGEMVYKDHLAVVEEGRA